jgi:ubiquitin-like domain-containing CTD phosphatase 1
MTHDALDCIMTTICTDRPLPAAIDDYGRNNTSTNLLQQIYESEIQKWSFHVTHNDGEYAKLAMGPLWSEILENIRPIINPDDGQSPPNRLALVSGHDTTILPLLVTLGPGVWDGQWPPYASMMIIEIHEIIDGKTDRTIFKSDFMFRLLMNGQARTSKIQGCPPDGELCDVQILMDRVSPFATSDRDCNSRTTHQYPAIQESKMLLSTWGGVILVLLFTLASGLLGSLFTFYYMTRRLPCRKRPAYHVGNGVSSYHDEIDGFQDEPEDVDGGENAQLKTVAALVE